MPAMLRKKGKATRIAHDLMGTPQNSQQRKSSRKNKVEQRLAFEETTRVR
jgi:hypothetical protein